MNIQVLILSLTILFGLGISQNCFAKPTIPTENSYQSRVLDMQNMTCDLCQFTIKKALKNVDGVQTVKVDPDKKTASITYNPQKTNIESIIKATTNAGYPATVQAAQ